MSELARTHSSSQLLPGGKPSNGSVPHGDDVTKLRERPSEDEAEVGVRARKPLFSEFATTESGIHGAAILGNPKNHPMRRAVWLLLVLTSCGLLGWALADRIQKYQSYEFSTQVTLKYQQQLLFPAVTLCNFNPFLQTKVNDTFEKAVLSLLKPQLSTDSSITSRVGEVAKKLSPPSSQPQGPHQAGQGPHQAGGTRQRRQQPAGGTNNNNGGAQQVPNGDDPPNREKRAAQTKPMPGVSVTARSTTKPVAQTTAKSRATTQAKPGTTKPVAQTTAKSKATTLAKPGTAPPAGTTQPKAAAITKSYVQTTHTAPAVTTHPRALTTKPVVGQTSKGAANTQTSTTRRIRRTVSPTAGPSGPPAGTQAQTGGVQRTVQPDVSRQNGGETSNGRTGQETGNTEHRITETEFLSLTDDEVNQLLVNVSVSDFFLQNGHQIEDMLLSCSWRGQNCSASDFNHVFTTYGNCYTFNANQDLYASQAGAGNGLELLLDSQQDDYLQGIQDQEAGFRILTHTKDESPALTVDSLGFAAAPGTKSFIGISLKKVM